MTKKIWNFCLSGLIIITCSTAGIDFDICRNFVWMLIYFFLVNGIWCWEGNEETKTRINCNEVSCLVDKFFSLSRTQVLRKRLQAD